MRPIVRSLIFDEVIVWDNSQLPDMKTYGRYAAAAEASNEVVWFQDDDVIVPQTTQRQMCRHYTDGVLNVNMEPKRHTDSWVWVGWGSLVQRELPQLAFQSWSGAGHEMISTPFRIVGCDIVSGQLTQHRKHAFPYQQLDYAYGADRAYQTDGFQEWKAAAYDRASRIRPVLKLNLGCGAHRLDGFVNLDLLTGWRFEDGLPYEDGSVQAITVSHALMYVELPDWPGVFQEIARVLEPGGMVRVTEDATTDPKSPRFGGHDDAVTLTDPPLVVGYMTLAGLEAQRVGEDETGFRDRSLIQRWHGAEPKVFHCEGVKP